jgi:hypothetical protein
MPASEWESLKNAEPHGGRCNHAYTEDRFNWHKTTCVKITGTVFPSPGSHSFSAVGISKKSYCGSFSTTKPCLKLNFSKYNGSNEDAIEDLIGTQFITLNNCIQDKSYIRQPLGYTLFKQAGLAYSRCNLAHVYVNDIDLGFYVNVEPIKKRYLQHNFNDNDKGNLYEIEAGEDFDQATMDSGRISFEGFSDHSDKKDLKLATQEIQNNGLAGMAQVIDVNQFIRFFAMEALLKHWDGYTDNRNNTYIYNDVNAAANPTLSNVNFKFIPWGIDQILQEDAKFQIDDDSVLGLLIRSDENSLLQLKNEIRNYSNTIFDRDNYENVLTPYINRMESILTGAGVPGVSSEIDMVRKQLKLVKSGAFQLLGEFPADSAFLLDRATDECVHASNTEPVGSGFEVYHRMPTTSRSDRWYVSPSATHIGTHKVINRKYGTYLHCSLTFLTSGGNFNVYNFHDHPNYGNYYYVEPIDYIDKWEVSGYFRLLSFRTLNYIYLSDIDLTPKGRKEVHQMADTSKATIFYLF